MWHTATSTATRTNEEVLKKQERKKQGDFLLWWILFCFGFGIFVLFLFSAFVHLLAYFDLFPYMGACGRDEGENGETKG